MADLTKSDLVRRRPIAVAPAEMLLYVFAFGLADHRRPVGYADNNAKVRID